MSADGDVSGAGTTPIGGAGAMTGTEVNQGRRYFLIGATGAVAAAGAVGVAVPFLGSWQPSAKARAAGAPITVDITKLEEGQMLGPLPEWRGQPVFVLKRNAAAVAQLEQDNDSLADPDSTAFPDNQPDYAMNRARARKPEIGVYVGICTHLGCSPKYYGEVQPEAFDPNWQGGFFCPCHGSRFDLAGRVVKSVPAPSNLVVPPYSYLSDSVILIGEDEETA